MRDEPEQGWKMRKPAVAQGDHAKREVQAFGEGEDLVVIALVRPKEHPDIGGPAARHGPNSKGRYITGP